MSEHQLNSCINHRIQMSLQRAIFFKIKIRILKLLLSKGREVPFYNQEVKEINVIPQD